jgi:hypothetical protein
MKEHPILFSGEMVNAIIEGRKTQTRRVIRPQPILMESGTWYPSEKPGDAKNKTGLHYANEKHMRNGMPIDFSPFGQPGDRLWVREKWKISSFMEGEPIEFQYAADGATADENEYSDCIDYEKWYENVCFQSTNQLMKMNWPLKNDDGIYSWERGNSPLPWRPSIYMPRWASRITLEIINITLERVWEMSEKDAIAEGLIPAIAGVDPNYLYRIAYRDFWEQLNSKRGFVWDFNPWVWEIKFNRFI